MQYRPFGNIDFQVSALGFGTMRLPTCSEDPGDVDFPESTRIIRHAIDQGVNYIDTAYPYHNEQSEAAVARALAGGYRQRVKIADKLPTWLVKEQADVQKLLDTQLQRLKTDHIDFYLVHNLNHNLWPIAKQHDVIPALEKAKAQGKIGHIGFSFHDVTALFKEIIDYYPGWEFTQIQYNYVNETVQAGTEGLKHAAAKGLPVVIMEPLLGGCLANVPKSVRDVFAASPHSGRSPVEWALQWLWNCPEIATVLSGMGAMEQVQENLACAARSGVDSFTPQDLQTIQEAAGAYRSLNPIPCTKCRYCMPCPHGVDIPRNFEMYNDFHTFEGNQRMLNRIIYGNFFAAEHRADQCIQCGECVPKCPQSIDIPQLMPQVHELLIQPGR